MRMGLRRKQINAGIKLTVVLFCNSKKKKKHEQSVSSCMRSYNCSTIRLKKRKNINPFSVIFQFSNFCNKNAKKMEISYSSSLSVLFSCVQLLQSFFFFKVRRDNL